MCLRKKSAMDWAKLSADVSAWGERAKATLSDAADAAQSKVEEAKLQLLHAPVVVGPYTVVKLKRLAEGGFSEVFLVREADGEQLFALKRMVCQTPAAKADAKSELAVLKVRP